MAQRTGLRTLRNLAQKLCLLVGAFAPIIRRAFPSSTALHVAMDTALAACAVLVTEADLVLPVGD